jgi:hypothetical protein
MSNEHSSQRKEDIDIEASRISCLHTKFETHKLINKYNGKRIWKTNIHPKRNIRGNILLGIHLLKSMLIYDKLISKVIPVIIFWKLGKHQLSFIGLHSNTV